MSDTATAPDLDIKKLILDLHQKVDSQNQEIASLRARVREHGNAIPKYQVAGGRQDYDTLFSGHRKGQGYTGDGDHARLVTGTDSFPLSDRELSLSPPMFDVGDLVELNMDATRDGSPKAWREIYEEACAKQRQNRKRIPSKVGRVKHIQYRRDSGTYKYRVIFPGLTGLNPDRDRGDGFDETELQAVS